MEQQNTHLTIAYFGRLEDAKGFKILLEVAKQTPHISYLVFGTGTLSKNLKLTPLKNLQPKPGKIHYFGYQNFNKIIKPILQKFADYTIMPSLSLETFGLSALQSIEIGIPVIGPNKGGLGQFVQPTETLQDISPQAIAKKLNSLQKPSHTTKLRLKKLAENYSTDRWLKNFKQLIPKNTQKILLATDFLQKIGGTEDHLYAIQNILKPHYKVQIYGTNNKPDIHTMFHAIHNKDATKGISTVIKQFKPDLIWCHSILRQLGPFVLKTINQQSKSFKIITHHDFGLFTAHPSKLTQQSDINKPSTIFSIKKFLLINPIIKQLQQFNLHIAPSPFMKPIIKTHFQNVEILRHFNPK